MKHRRSTPGFMLTELIVSLSGLGILMAMLAVTLFWAGRCHHLLFLRQKCIAAAQAQIESICTRGLPIEPNKATALWPDVELQTQILPGLDQWQGLGLIQATASIRSGRTVVQISLARYALIPDWVPYERQ